MSSILNYENLEKPIVEIEAVLERFDSAEKNLILSFIRERIIKKKQAFDVQETINNNPLTKFANKFIKDKNLEDK